MRENGIEESIDRPLTIALVVDTVGNRLTKTEAGRQILHGHVQVRARCGARLEGRRGLRIGLHLDGGQRGEGFRLGLRGWV